MDHGAWIKRSTVRLIACHFLFFLFLHIYFFTVLRLIVLIVYHFYLIDLLVYKCMSVTYILHTYGLVCLKFILIYRCIYNEVK